ncbi:MAG TPA: V-type ATP synthase subunit C [Lachnospiraceae bacterium]|nr:V-type ATP synthase subunit C [Lachnospiraceae bacterium]
MAKDQIYPYAVARIRMLERSLLTWKKYIQMAESKTIEGALKILSEAGYGNGNSLGVKEYEEALSDQLAKAYADVSELVSGHRFMDVFLIKNDYHNLKVLMKEDISGIDGSNYLVGGGTVRVEVLKAAFQMKSYDALPENMVVAITEAYSVYGKTMSGQMIDIVMDKAAFKNMNTIAHESSNHFIKRYVEYVCDITNLKTFLRFKNMKKPFEMFTEVFVAGGILGLDSFKTAFNAENPAAGFKGTYYAELCKNMTKGFTVFEKKCDDYIMLFIRDAKYKSLTLEPMIGYIYAKETEVKTVRIIFNSKVNNIDSDIIKERLRDAYV